VLNPIALSIPAFFLLIGAELVWAWRAGRLRGERPIYRPVDAITDLSCGISSQVTGLLLAAVVFAGVYTLAWSELRLLTLPDSLPVWLGTFVLVDLVYYLWHRASHRVNLLWAAHIVHHQSEDYNLAVALRQAFFTPLTTLPFYIPIALLGVSPLVFLTTVALNTVYQFWIHTRLVGRLGPVEWVMNTPSHHRVHHGINPEYIDRNHAGVFIVWDRLFGTFTPEGQEPVYGTVQGHHGANAIAANLQPVADLFRLAARRGGLDAVKTLIGPPEWRPASEGGPQPVPVPNPGLRWDPHPPTPIVVYSGVWMLLASLALTIVLFAQADLPLAHQGALAFLLLWTVGAWGGLLDERPWAVRAEALRLLVLPMLLIGVDPRLAAVGAVLSLGSGLALWRARRAH